MPDRVVLEVRFVFETFQTDFALELGLHAALVFQVSFQVTLALVVRAATAASVPSTFCYESRVITL